MLKNFMKYIKVQRRKKMSASSCEKEMEMTNLLMNVRDYKT